MSERYSMNCGWRFHRGEVHSAVGTTHSAVYAAAKAGAAQGAAAPGYDDYQWREVTLPHDYFTESEIGKDYLLSSGYRKPDNAWYRKTFLLDEAWREQRLFLSFEGVAVFAEFYLNGSLLARSFNGYAEIRFDITDRAYFGDRPNVLAVHINGCAKQGWWYEGAGIYRNVWLEIKPPLHIAHDGVFVKPTLQPDTANDWWVDVEITLENSLERDETATVGCAIFFDGEPIGAVAPQPVRVGYADAETVTRRITVCDPRRWDVDAPHLYETVVTLGREGKVLERQTAVFGFRTIAADAERGFLLNGRPLKIQGTCNHQDHAAVGVAIPDRVWRYRLELLKEMGCNAYRSAHNPASPAVLEWCDRLGILVMDENRVFESTEENLALLRAMVRRDRNHPSVVFYSLFNEEPLQTTDEGRRIFTHMKNAVRRLDDTRLITGGINSVEPYEGAGPEMDILGINYGLFDAGNVIEATHERLADKPLIGSETCSALYTRGCYRPEKSRRNECSAYDVECVSWGNTMTECWRFARSHEYYAGIFAWTGFDYRGEPTPFEWPSVSTQFGILDTCGFKKAAFYYYQACFCTEPILKLIPHWNWEPGETVRVVAATNCDKVELFLNGVSLGIQTADCCALPEWTVPFVPGELTAQGYRAGVCVVSDTQRTADTPTKILAESVYPTADNDGQDCIVVNCRVVDRLGNCVETADNELRFAVEGDGCLLGTGNGDPNSHSLDTAAQVRLFAGRAQAIFRVLPQGRAVRISVTSPGLVSCVVEPKIRTSTSRKSIAATRDYYIHSVFQSCVTGERPEPCMEIADNDMNTLTPVGFSFEHFQHDFTSGWRLYRVTMREKTAARLVLQQVRGRLVDIYINGKLCCRVENCAGDRVECPLEGNGQRDDIRILIQAWENGESGIRGGILRVPAAEER